MFLMVEIKEPQLKGPCMVLLGFPSKSVEERQKEEGTEWGEKHSDKDRERRSSLIYTISPPSTQFIRCFREFLKESSLCHISREDTEIDIMTNKYLGLVHLKRSARMWVFEFLVVGSSR